MSITCVVITVVIALMLLPLLIGRVFGLLAVHQTVTNMLTVRSTSITFTSMSSRLVLALGCSTTLLLVGSVLYSVVFPVFFWYIALVEMPCILSSGLYNAVHWTDTL
jgi:hypothetical protein